MNAPLPYVAWQMSGPGQTYPEYWSARTEREAREMFRDANCVDAEACEEVLPGSQGYKALDEYLTNPQDIRVPGFICGGDYD